VDAELAELKRDVLPASTGPRVVQLPQEAPPGSGVGGRYSATTIPMMKTGAITLIAPVFCAPAIRHTCYQRLRPRYQ
jgi:hypothetical protein